MEGLFQHGTLIYALTDTTSNILFKLDWLAEQEVGKKERCYRGPH